MKKRILALLLIMTMIIPSLMMPVAAAPQKANGYIEAADTYGAVAKAVVTKLNGNQNGLTITVSVDGVVVAYRYVLINNNSAGEFVVGDYKVYVSTYGNDKIDYCFITYAPEPPCGHDWVTVFTATCLYGGISKEVCGLCGGEQNEEIVSALGHDFSEEVETVPPTSQKEGYTVYKCVRCDETKTFVLPGVMRDITGTEFVNEMGLGWNLGNALDSAGYPYGSERNFLGLDEMSWGSPMITKSMIDAVAEAGFKTLRIPITWETKIGPAPDYKITDVWMNRVEEIVNYGLANDMTVIINIHHDGWISLSNNSGAAKTAANAQFTAVWTQIADRFKNYGDKLVFESLNEPREYGANNEWTGGSTQGRNYLNELNQLMVNTVRGTGGNNEKRFIMVPTYAAGSNTTSMQGFNRPNDPTDPDYEIKRIILSVHSYEPGGLSTGDIRWQGSTSQNGVNNIFTQANRVNATANRNGGMPVVMGEFAWINNDNLAAREIFSQYYVYAAKQYGYACIWWDGMNTAANTEESTAIFIRDPANPTFAFPSIVEAMLRGLNGDSGLTSGMGVKIDPAQKTLRLGLSATQQLRHYVFPLSGSQTVSWSSSNTAVATVSSSGVVTAQGPGTATITASAGGNSAACAITVKADTTTRYNRLYDFDFDGLDGIAQGDTDNTTNSYSVAWLGDGWNSNALKISDIKKTANPSQTGVYDWTSVSIFTPAANAPLIRRSNYLSYDFLIKVGDTAPDFNFIGTVLKTGASFPGDEGWKGWWDERHTNIGSEMTTITIDGEEYYHVAFKTFVGDHIQYISNTTAVTLCFILENFNSTADIYIDNILFTGGIDDADYPEFPEIPASDVAVNGVSIQGPDAAKTHVQGGSLYIAQGASMPLNAAVSPANATNKNVYSWASNNAGVTVDRFTGVITGVTANNTARNITVRSVNMDRVSPNFGVIVARPVSGVTIDKTAEIEIGKDLTLVPTVPTTGSGTTTAVTTVFWVSSDEDVATVDENGKVTAVGLGTATITATSRVDWSKSAECEVTVEEPAEPEPANFKVEGSKILDLDGNEFLMKGVNINGPGWCFSRGTMQDVNLIVNTWKFNSVRLCAATKWRTMTGYNNNATDNFDTIIKAFTDRGIVVMIENHDYTGIWPTDAEQRIGTNEIAPTLNAHIAWWVDLAERFGDNPYVWFNIMNEPGQGYDQQQAEKWFDVHDQVIAAIRATGTNNIIVCDEYDYGQGGGYMDRGTGWCSAVIRKGPELNAKYDNLVFSLHPYGWADGKARFDAYFNDAKELGLAVILGEYGVGTNSLAGSNATYNMFNAAIEHNIGRMYWAWDDGGLPMCTGTGGQGWRVNQTNGTTKPTNLTWAGGLVWDDNRGNLTAPVPMYNLPPAVLTNGNFNTNLNGWGNWGNFTRVTTAPTWNGTAYAQIGVGSGGFGQDFTVRPNTTYRLSAAAYGVADLGLKYPYTNENMRGGVEFEYHNFINFNFPDEWNADFITFTTPADLYATQGTVFIWKNDGPAFRIDDIELIEVIISDIAVKTMPDKLTYGIGESFDCSGLSLDVNYAGRASDVLVVKGLQYVDQNNDGVIEISGFDSSVAGIQTVTILYNKKTVTFDITVEGSGGDTDPGEPLLTMHELAEAMHPGWNFTGGFEASGGISGFDSTGGWTGYNPSEAMVKAIADAGFKSIRIPITWDIGNPARITGSSPNYTIRPEFLAKIKDVIDWANKYGMVAIINVHHDGSNWWLKPQSGSTFSENVLAKYAAIWQQTAEYFKDYAPQKLIFEGLNEPNFDDSWWWNANHKTALEQLQEIFYQTVRGTGSNNEVRPLVIQPLYAMIWLCGPEVGDSLTAKYNDLKAKDIALTGTSNILATVHWYGANNNTPLSEIQGAMSWMQKYIADYDIPFFIGECGSLSQDSSYGNEAAFLTFWENYITEAQKRNITVFHWDNADSRGQFQHGTNTWRNNRYLDITMGTYQGGGDDPVDPPVPPPIVGNVIEVPKSPAVIIPGMIADLRVDLAGLTGEQVEKLEEIRLYGTASGNDGTFIGEFRGSGWGSDKWLGCWGSEFTQGNQYVGIALDNVNRLLLNKRADYNGPDFVLSINAAAWDNDNNEYIINGATHYKDFTITKVVYVFGESEEPGEPEELTREENIEAVLAQGFTLVNMTIDISQLPNGYDSWGQNGINVVDFNGMTAGGTKPVVYVVNEDGTLGEIIGLGNAEDVANGIKQIEDNKISFYIDNKIQNKMQFRLRTGDWWQTVCTEEEFDVSAYQGKIYNVTAVLIINGALNEGIIEFVPLDGGLSDESCENCGKDPCECVYCDVCGKLDENCTCTKEPNENTRDENIQAVLANGFTLVNVTIDISQLPNNYDSWGQKGINVADFNGPGSGNLPKVYIVNEDGTLGAQIGLGNAEDANNGITQIIDGQLSFYVDNSVQNRIEFRLRTGDWWQVSCQAILDVSEYQGVIYNIKAVLIQDAPLEFVSLDQ